MSIDTKNAKNKMNIASKLIVALLFVCFLSVAYQVCAKNIIYEKLGFDSRWFLNSIKTDDNFDAPKSVNRVWSEEYPFSKTPAYEQESIFYTNRNKSQIENSGKFSVMLSKIYSVFEKYTSDYFTFTDMCERVSKQFNNCLGYRLSTDAYGDNQLFLSNDHMTYERSYASVDKQVNNIVNFSNWLRKQNIDYFHVIIPDPVSPEEEKEVQARGYMVYSNQMADELYTDLIEERIACVDIRNYMEAEGRSYTDDFFKYEHHMVPEAGLWVAGKVSENINKVMDITSDNSIFDIGQYNVTAVSKSSDLLNDKFWIYTGTENLDLLHPKFETNITKYIADIDLEITGDFDETMYAMWELPTYNTWNHGIRAIKTYRNNNIDHNQPKILLLTESYSDVISPFLACAYANIDEIDLRIFSGCLQTYIEETKPDLVISMYSAYDLNSSGAEPLFRFN